MPAAKKAKKKKPVRAPRRKKAPAAPRGASEAERIAALTKVFAALGARDPARWAQRHIKQDRDELGRYVLLRALWMRIVEPGRLLARARKDADTAAAIDRLLKWSDLSDLDAVVRAAQRVALEDICGVLDDPAQGEGGIGWGVFRLDKDGAPLWPLPELRRGLIDSEP